MIRSITAILALVILASPAQAYKEGDLVRVKNGEGCRECDLYKADLKGVDHRGAQLPYTNLNSANLVRADLSYRENVGIGANLIGARLRSANLKEANLTSAYLDGTDLTNADLTGAILFDSHGLSTLVWEKLPRGIYGIREALKKGGEREAERELTYSIMRNRRRNTGGIEGAFNYVLFEVTSAYGLSPGRPLMIMVALIFVFAVFYRIALDAKGMAGIWVVWAEDRVHKDVGDAKPVRLQTGPWVRYAWAFYFSVLSAFHIGWRDLNVGNWIVRMQPHEYTFRATGWVRTVSGIHSLISLYLVALAVLIYFGRPFE